MDVGLKHPDTKILESMAQKYGLKFFPLKIVNTNIFQYHQNSWNPNEFLVYKVVNSHLHAFNIFLAKYFKG